MDRHPALARLDVLIGRWTVQVKLEGMGAAWTEYSWTEDGWFLRELSGIDPEVLAAAPEVWRKGTPFPTVTLIGLDDGSGEYTRLYADARGVHRVYRMTFDGVELRHWRNAPGFNQRFTGRLSEDGDVLDGAWEFSEDGENWRVDFGVVYRRES